MEAATSSCVATSAATSESCSLARSQRPAAKGKPPEELHAEHRRFTEYAQEWIRTFPGLTKRGVGPSTREDYAASLGLTTNGGLLEPERGAVKFFGRMWLEQITTPDLRRYADALFARGLVR